MKAASFMALCCIVMQSLQAQDNFYGHYSPLRPSNNTELQPNGFQNLRYDTISNKPAIVRTAATGRAINYIGINKNGFLYGIEGVFNQGYNVIAYDTKNNYAPTLVLTDAY